MLLIKRARWEHSSLPCATTINPACIKAWPVIRPQKWQALKRSNKPVFTATPGSLIEIGFLNCQSPREQEFDMHRTNFGRHSWSNYQG